MASEMPICLRCGREGHAARECSLSFFKSDNEARREVAKMVRQRAKGVREAEKLLKAKERKEKKDVDREVAQLLSGEAKERENMRILTASGRTQTDAAGVQWKHDPQTNWWYWRDSEGEWRSTSHKYTTKEDLDKARVSAASGSIVRDADGVEWKQDAETEWWWWRDSKGEWRSTNRQYKPSNGPASSSDESKSVASTASTAATATPAVTRAVSEEYKELQRVQQKLSEIAILEDRKARGDTLTKYEESAIRRKAEFYYDPVMVKHRSDKFRTGKGKGSV